MTMGRNSNGIRTSRQKQSDVNLSDVSVNSISSALSRYARINTWTEHSSVPFMEQAQWMIDRVADGSDFGAQVAQTVKSHGYAISQKQAYIIATSAYRNKEVMRMTFGNGEGGIFRDRSRMIQQGILRKKQKHKEKIDIANSGGKSRFKVDVGTQVTNEKGKSGVIKKIITKSTGYVLVDYGTYTKKEMAFNLKGLDGKLLKLKK